MKKYLELFWSHKKWVRKYIGGKWVRDRRDGCMWVRWNHPFYIEVTGWPLNEKEYICEEYLMEKAEKKEMQIESDAERLAKKIEKAVEETPNGNPFAKLKFTDEERKLLAEAGIV